MSEHAEHAEHTDASYIKIWGILVALLVVSVVGPMFEIRVVTLLTAFGIAIVKAYMVAKHFMHVNVEPRFVPYMLITTLVFMLLFFAGTAPDVMKDAGSGWMKPAEGWQAESFAAEAAGHGDEHGGGH